MSSSKNPNVVAYAFYVAFTEKLAADETAPNFHEFETTVSAQVHTISVKEKPNFRCVPI